MSWFRPARGDERPRVGLLLFVALQLLVTAGLPMGDAALEAAASASGLHVEAAAEEPCGHGHDHAFCQLCRALGLPGLPGPATTDARFARVEEQVGSARPSHHHPPGLPPAGAPGARAPPVA